MRYSNLYGYQLLHLASCTGYSAIAIWVRPACCYGLCCLWLSFRCLLFSYSGVPNILKLCDVGIKQSKYPVVHPVEDRVPQSAYDRQMNSRFVKACLTAGCSVVGPVLAFSASGFGVKALESGGGTQSPADSSSSSVSTTRRYVYVSMYTCDLNI